MRRFFYLSVSLVVILLGNGTTVCARSYAFTTIDVPGARSTNVRGINDAGQIVGSFAGFITGVRKFQGFLLAGSTFTTIDVPGV